MVYFPEESNLKDLLVEANGFEFNMKTFENPELRKFIEGSLMQAIGRARLIRTLSGFQQLNTNNCLILKQGTLPIREKLRLLEGALDEICEPAEMNAL